MGHKPVLLWVPYRHMRPQSPHVTACPPVRRCQEEVVRKRVVRKKVVRKKVVRKLFGKFVKTRKIVLIVEANCMDKNKTIHNTSEGTYIQ